MQYNWPLLSETILNNVELVEGHIDRTSHAAPTNLLTSLSFQVDLGIQWRAGTLKRRPPMHLQSEYQRQFGSSEKVVTAPPQESPIVAASRTVLGGQDGQLTHPVPTQSHYPQTHDQVVPYQQPVVPQETTTIARNPVHHVPREYQPHHRHPQHHRKPKEASHEPQRVSHRPEKPVQQSMPHHLPVQPAGPAMVQQPHKHR